MFHTITDDDKGFSGAIINLCTHGEQSTGLEIRVDRWPESTKNPVGPPNRVRQWSGGLPNFASGHYIC